GVAAAVAALQSSRNAAEAERQAVIAAQNEATALSEAERADANAAEAEENARQAALNAKLAGAREMAASAIAVLNNDPELSTLLAVRAIDETPEGVEQPIEVINALWRAGISNRLVDLYPTETGAKLSLSPDGARLAVSENQTLRMLDAATGEPVWAYTEETVDVFDIVDIGPDGRVALGVLNSDAAAVSHETDDVDGRPNRIVILDGDGQAIHTIEYPDCPGVDNPAWSPDGRYLAVASGHSVGCPRDGAAFWIEVYETESWEPAAFIPFDGGPELVQAQFGRNGPRAVWDDTGALHGLIYGGSVLVVEPETFAPRTRSSATGIGDVSPDGTHYVVDNSSSPGGTAFSAYLIDATTGQSSDVLYDGKDNPSHPNGIEITPDGSLAVIGTVGSHTYVYDMATNEELFRLATGEVAASAYDPATQRLYTAGSDPGVKVWDLRSSTIGVEATGDLGQFGWVNGNSFVTGPQATAMDTVDFGSESWQVQLFDPDTGELRHSLLDHVGPVALANGHWVLYKVAGSETRATILWDPDTGEQIEILGCEVPVDNELGGQYCAGDSEPRDWHWQVSPDGEEILAYGSDGEFEFTYSGHFRQIDPDTGEVTESVNPGDQPSPNDPYTSLGTGSPSSHASFAGPLDILTDHWAFGATHQGSTAHDLTTGDALFEGGRLYLVLEASPDHGLIAFGDSPNSVTLLDTTVWQEVARIPADARLRGLGFNADGSLLAIGDLHSLRIVDTATGQVVQQMALAGVSDVHWMDDETLLIGTNTGVFGTVSLSTED
ncbi:MAG TPA: hypothetical protein VK969_12985, partial [Acidimicrobiia bacterium]|nr:hypothetical protein [Acidimicrobiia bacterium]